MIYVTSSENWYCWNNRYFWHIWWDLINKVCSQSPLFKIHIPLNLYNMSIILLVIFEVSSHQVIYCCPKPKTSGETESESDTWRRFGSWWIPNLSEAEIWIQNQHVTNIKSNLRLISSLFWNRCNVICLFKTDLSQY